MGPKSDKKYGLVAGLILVILIVPGYAFEKPLLRPVEFQQSPQFRKYFPINLYTLSYNPALFKLNYPRDFLYYQTFAARQNNMFQRTFDPAREDRLGFDVQMYRRLNKKVAIISGATYQRKNLHQVYRSLEKNYYDHYFAYTDTTTGNFEYHGPQLWFLYNRSLGNHLDWGFNINYSVERALKDVYTKCETIIRNTDVSTGLSYYNRDTTLQIGFFGRYFNRQGSYEAVKEMKDALVKTYFGYHVFREEDPRSSNRKNDDRQGYEFGLQFSRKNLIIDNLNIDFAASYGSEENDIEVGSVSRPKPRGYWIRQGWRGMARLHYQHHNKLDAQFFYSYTDLYDWGQSGLYDVLILENELVAHRLGGSVGIFPLRNLETTLGGEVRVEDGDYREYIKPFQYQEVRQRRRLYTQFKWQLNQITGLYLQLNYQQGEPYFYWETERFDRQSCDLGFERQFVIGLFNLNLHYEQCRPQGSEDIIEAFGLSIAYVR